MKDKTKVYEEISDEPERKYKTVQQMYCDNYEKNELSCIQCYENQTAHYKACYKKGE